MAKIFKVALLFSLAVLAIGCGGVGSLLGGNPYAGFYTNGIWTESSATPAHNGTWNVVISSSGSISGSCTYSITGGVQNVQGTISGTVDGNGNVVATCTWNSGTPTTTSINGTLTLQTLTHIQGTLYESPVNNNGQATMTLNMDNV